MRTVKITHRFNLDVLDHPRRALRAFGTVTLAVFVGGFADALGPVGALAALGVLVATGTVSIGLGAPETPQEAPQEPADAPVGV